MENQENDRKAKPIEKTSIKESLKLLEANNPQKKETSCPSKHDSKISHDQSDKLNINLEKNKINNLRRFTLNSEYLNKPKNPENEHNVSCYKNILHFLHEAFEHIIMQIFIILLSIFSLFHEDIKILSLPKTVDYPFHHVNEFIFFFFLTEFLVFILAQKNFIGSFYFYLDIVSLISLLPEVHLIWDQILYLIESDSS